MTQAVVWLYGTVLVLLSIYGLHRVAIVYLYNRTAGSDPEPNSVFEDLPKVTVQLPVYNEKFVVDRLIESVCRLEYPTDKLEIQVLDDSTDETTDIARQLVESKKQEGYNIELLHREDRTGYKAGALAEGLQEADGEFVAIFDADFVPRPGFLKDTIHHFTDPNVGVVQGRWSYINRDESLLTRLQSILLDGHFVLEHTARFRSGRFFNFNGTAGIWRRETIRDAGGWQHDTLTEDLDLSYRAQLEGWDFVYLKDVTVPSELPTDIAAFRSQQHRWTKGGVETGLKLLPRILTSEQSWRVKGEAFFHLTSNIAYLLMVCLAVLLPMATIIRIEHGWYEALLFDVPVFLCATVSICYFYLKAATEAGRSFGESLALIPGVLALGIGMCINNAKGVVEALVGYTTPFVRTPKYGGEAVRKIYGRMDDVLPLAEFTFGIWFTAAAGWILICRTKAAVSLPFLSLFQMGFLYVALVSIYQRLNPMTPAKAEE
jgi:cellulose synthase/poly-beta-1,6-N-acetylglucosamine synthase-like glycosyltransferase